MTNNERGAEVDCPTDSSIGGRANGQATGSRRQLDAETAEAATRLRVLADKIEQRAGVRADGRGASGPDHDVRALELAIETALDPDGPLVASVGPYRARCRPASVWFPAADDGPRKVIIGYDSDDEWIVLPAGLAETVLNAIADRRDGGDDGGEA